MKKNYLRTLIAVSIISAAMVFTGCQSSNTGVSTTTAAASTSASSSSQTVSSDTKLVTLSDAGFSSDDDYTDWENSEYTSITAQNGTFTVSGDGAQADGNTVTINHKGTFVLSGTIDDGTVIVDSDTNGTVRLVLNNFSITCSNGAPIYIKNSDVVLSLAPDTTNSVTDSEDYTYKYYDESENEPNAAIFAKDDLVINGTGTLNVTANHKNGIQSKDSLKVVEGTINITSVDDGFVGKDLAAFKNGTFTLTTTGDAIKSTGTDEGTGNIIIGGGTYTITSQGDALAASGQLYAQDGTFNIKTGEGGGTFSPKSGMGMQPQNQNSSGTPPFQNGASSQNQAPSGMPDGGQMPADSTSDSGNDSTSMKGLKSDTIIHIAGGTFNLDTEDDAVHSNDTVIIDGGEFTINTGDDALHADTTLTVNDGTINISNCNEGLEAATINVNGGDTTVNSTDDGVNASEKNTTTDTSSAKTGDTSSASSSDTSSSATSSTVSQASNSGRPSGGMGAMTSGNAVLNITGGTLKVNAYGDGLDSNGSIYMSGGTVTVSGPTDSGNGDLDYDKVFEISGGTLVTAGSSGMAQNPSDSSKQYSIAGILDSTQAAGSEVSLSDDSGNVIASFTVDKEYSHIVFSSPKLESSKTYHILVNGTEVKSVQVSDITTLFSEMKSSMGGAMNGKMGGGPGKGMGGRKTQSGTDSGTTTSGTSASAS